MINLRSAASALIKDKAGNFAIITGLCALPLMGLMGLSIDWGISLSNKARLDAAADAAAIAASKAAQDALFAKSGDPVALGKARGLAVFKANAALISFGTSTSAPVPDIVVTPSPDGSGVTTQVSYATENASQFGRLFNVQKNKLGGTAISSLVPKHVNIYLVVDISQSMGIAGSDGDMTLMGAIAPGGCVFGCHVPQGSDTFTYEALAHLYGVKLRIDVIRDAIKAMLNQLNGGTGSTYIKVALYTYEFDLQHIFDLTDQFNSVIAQANALDLGANIRPGTSYVDTKSADSYAQASINMLSPLQSGDGTTDAKATNYIFFLTDGTSDTLDPSNTATGHAFSAYDPAWFKPLKDAGNTIGVIYTTYKPIYNYNNPANGLNPFYIIDILPLNDPSSSKIRTGLQNSATSSEWFIEASDGSSIQTALQKLLDKARSSNRLTK